MLARRSAGVHFAPGKYAPDSSHGGWLIAHELAHVVQQTGAPPSPQRFDPAEPGLAHEAEADRAADAAVSGGKAEVQLAARDGVRQSYEAWEHRALGDSGGGADRTVMVNCGITLTYGQIAALSGDFYRSPEALMNAPYEELKAILKVMNDERKQVGATRDNPIGTRTPTPEQSAENTKAYDLATTGSHSRAGHDHHCEPLLGDADHDAGPDAEHPHGRVTDGEHVEDGGSASGLPSADDGFLDSAKKNNSHYSPENIALNYKPKHQLAIDLAREAYKLRHPGGTPGPARTTGQPQSTSTPATAPPGAALPVPAAEVAAAAAPHTGDPPTPERAHSYTDVVGAATPSKSTVNTRAEGPQGKEAAAYLTDGFAAHFLTDAFASGHLINGQVGRTRASAFFSKHYKTVTASLLRCFQVDYPNAAKALGPSLGWVITSAAVLVATEAGNLGLRVVHDRLNRDGVMVKNPLGVEWRTVGDSNLISSPQTQQQASLAAQASREGVEHAVRVGEIDDAERDRPLKHVPDMARFDKGLYRPVSELCTDPTLFDGMFRDTMLPRDAAKNELWGLIKPNAAAIATLWLAKRGRWVGDLATGGYVKAHQATDGLADGLHHAEDKIKHHAQSAGTQIAHGANRLEHKARKEVKELGDSVKGFGQVLWHGATTVGSTIERGAKAVAGWVSSWF